MTSFFFLIGTVLTQSIQMELSKKQKSFSEFFSASSVFRLNFEQFEKKMTLIAYVFGNLQTAKDVFTQMSKRPFFRRSFDRRHSKRTQTLMKYRGERF